MELITEESATSTNAHLPISLRKERKRERGRERERQRERAVASQAWHTRLLNTANVHFVINICSAGIGAWLITPHTFCFSTG